MTEFPSFMRKTENRIAANSQATPGVEGYVFDGADGSQMAFWTCPETGSSAAHAHEFDEYMLVVQGCYTLIIDGKEIPVRAGEEFHIPRGVSHSGVVVAGPAPYTSSAAGAQSESNQLVPARIESSETDAENFTMRPQLSFSSS